MNFRRMWPVGRSSASAIGFAVAAAVVGPGSLLTKATAVTAKAGLTNAQIDRRADAPRQFSR